MASSLSHTTPGAWVRLGKGTANRAMSKALAPIKLKPTALARWPCSSGALVTKCAAFHSCCNSSVHKAKPTAAKPNMGCTLASHKASHAINATR